MIAQSTKFYERDNLSLPPLHDTKSFIIILIVYAELKASRSLTDEQKKK